LRTYSEVDIAYDVQSLFSNSTVMHWASNCMVASKRPSIKDVRSWGGFVQCWQGGGDSSDADVHTLLRCVKNFVSLKFMGVSARKGGLSRCGQGGGGQFFAILCGRPL